MLAGTISKRLEVPKVDAGRAARPFTLPAGGSDVNDARPSA
jgi:hypothetical protein